MVFLTGGTGYAGRFLVDAFLKEGSSVQCLVRKTSQTEDLERRGVSLVWGDLEHPIGLSKKLKGIEAVVSATHIRHAPALISVCREAGVKRVVFLSSTWRFSKVNTTGVNTVIAGEEAVNVSGLETTLLRPTMIYGPGDDRNISRLRNYLRRYRIIPIFGNGSRLVQPVYVTDLAKAVVQAIGSSLAIGKSYQIAGADSMAYIEMINLLSQEIGRTVVKIHLPIFLVLPPIRVYERLFLGKSIWSDRILRMDEDRNFEISDAKQDLGFTPRCFLEGIREVISRNGEKREKSKMRNFSGFHHGF